MKPRWVIARKEFNSIFSERTILLAVVIQVFVAGFSSFLVVGLSALFDPDSLPSAVPISLAVDENLAEYDGLTNSLLAADIRIVWADDADDARSIFQRGRADGAMIAKPGAGENSTLPVELTIILPDGDLRATLTLVKVKDALESYERELRTTYAERIQSEPLYVDTEAKAGSYAFVYSLLIPLLVFLPVVLSGALSADSLTEEVQRGTLPLLLSSPATPSDIVEGKLFANVAIAPILTAAWFGLLAINGLPVPLVGGIAIIVLATAFSFLMGLLAAVIAMATRDRNKAHVIYATAMFFVLGASLALPLSPVNAVAVFAAGSPSPEAYSIVAILTGAAIIGGIALRLALRRTAKWMAGSA